MQKHSYHILFKEKEDAIVSRGITVEANNELDALTEFYAQSKFWNTSMTFLAMYSLDEMAKLETHQNSQT